MHVSCARALAVATLVLLASACSVANGTPPLTNAPAVVSRDDAAVVSHLPKGYGIVRFRVAVPGRVRGSASHRKLPAYVSSATRKVAVTVQGASQSTATTQKFQCTAVCSGKIVAPLGVDVITLQLEDRKNRVLSRGTSTIVVFKSSGNVFDFTLDGVPASVSLALDSAALPVVPAGAGYLDFDARDADGRIITPDGHYTDANGNPLVFSIASSNPAVRLSVTSVSAPGTPVAFSYDGTQHIGTITLTPRAARHIHTAVSFHPATLTLIPGIASRVAPPIPVQVLGATQVPMPAGSTACGGSPCADPNKVFVFGNAGAQQVVFTFDVTTSGYSVAPSTLAYPGQFVFAPVDLGGNGFWGYYANSPDTSNNWGVDSVYGFSGSYGGASTPCGSSYQTPIGYDGTDLYCAVSSANVYDYTSSTYVAYGFPRKIRTLNGTTYFVTANASAPSQQVYAKGSLTPIAGAYTMGANVTAPTTGYYGDSDGTVKAIAGGATVATFSQAIENVVGYGSSVYASENGRIFGVSGPSGTFETGQLPIGNVVEAVTGVNGAPVLVESDGTLDVMGI